MAKLNAKTAKEKIYTHEGAVAVHINPTQQLRRMVMSCMLWEREHYVDGVETAKGILEILPRVSPADVAQIAIEAREKQKLRHVPLLLVREMARLATHRGLVAESLARIIQRPDELTEYIAIYWKDGRKPLSAQSKKGLAEAFRKFNAYSLAKYNRAEAVKLRDVLFLSHPKAKDAEQAATWKKLVDGSLKAPDTWEVELSAGKDKKLTFERLMTEDKLYALAFLRNLRNMKDAGISKATIAAYAEKVDLGRVLPFRFIAAARAVPQWEDVIEPMFLRAAGGQEKLAGKTVLIVDVSGSMYSAGNISKNSDMTRVDAAGALAAIAREACEEVAIYATAGNDSARIHKTALAPPRRGFALVDQFTSQKFAPTLGGGGIFLTQCLDYVKGKEKTADRIIVLTDEQDCDNKLTPASADAFGCYNYLINVASAKNGIGYGKWTHIDGWSEACLEFIRVAEASTN